MNMKFSDEKYRLRTIEKDEEYLRSLSLDVLKDDSNLNEEIKYYLIIVEVMET